MFKWPSEQESVTHLDSTPGMDDIKKFMVHSARHKNVQSVYTWNDSQDNKATFKLTVQYVPKGFTFEWKLSLDNDSDNRLLWTRFSDDAEEIHLAMESSVESKEAESGHLNFDDTRSNLTRSQMNEAIRIYEQTFDSMSVKDMQQMSLVPETLTGNLEILQITNLLQSITMGQMSGRLRIKRAAAYADIFFEEGAAVHAEGSRAHGYECFIQVIGWKDGEFSFEPKLKTDEKTIEQQMESLILEGCLLMDVTEYVKKAGVQPQSVLIKTDESISEQGFEQALSEVDHNVDMGLLKALFLQIDSRKTVQDIVEILRLTRSQWIFATAAIMKANLLKAVEKDKIKRAKAPPKNVDYTPVKEINEFLIRKDSGLFSYPAFLFLLDHEFKYAWSRPVSIVLFGFQEKSGTNTNSITPATMKDIGRYISNVQGFKGMIAHYEQNGIVLSLVGANSSQAATIADRFVKSMNSSSLDLKLSALQIAIGIASYPDDADNVPSLLAAAELARDRAWSKGQNAILLASTLL